MIRSHKDSGPALRTRLRNAVSKNGLCCSELKLAGMKKKKGEEMKMR
jgi:hypothetical protein